MRLAVFVAAAARAMVVVLIVAACGSDSGPAASQSPSSSVSPTSTGDPVLTEPPGELPSGPSALDDMNDPAFPDPLVDPGQILSGGPPPDGIPSIDDPAFVSVEEAWQWLQDEEPVVYLNVTGDARAYPVQVLIWHEIINDSVGGVPVAITYCPLCNSAVSYERVVNEVETTFGTSGRLYASALVMYDRATESLWTHFDGRAVVGVLTGNQLEPISSPLIAWSEFAAAFPDGRVLDREHTGYDRPYGDNPYTGYDDPAAFPFLFVGNVDDRARAMQRVVGVEINDVPVAWTWEAIAGEEAKATSGSVADTPVVVFWKAGQVSALETGGVADGRDVGSVTVLSPVVDGQTLTFTTADAAFVDEQTGSTWDITGRATAGELAGTALERHHHFDTFWFAWATYQPGTELIEQTNR
jgi:hypothetical protein